MHFGAINSLSGKMNAPLAALHAIGRQTSGKADADQRRRISIRRQLLRPNKRRHRHRASRRLAARLIRLAADPVDERREGVGYDRFQHRPGSAGVCKSRLIAPLPPPVNGDDEPSTAGMNGCGNVLHM